MTCRNCTETVSTKYCAHCGQEVNLKRYAFSQDFFSDQLGRSFLFTVQMLLTKPGHGVREYIHGKRVSYFNPFTMVFILLAISLIIDSFLPSTPRVVEALQTEDMRLFIAYFTRQYPMLFMVVIILFNSMVSWFLFKRTEHYFLEIIVVNLFFIYGV